MAAVAAVLLRLAHQLAVRPLAAVTLVGQALLVVGLALLVPVVPVGTMSMLINKSR